MQTFLWDDLDQKALAKNALKLLIIPLFLVIFSGIAFSSGIVNPSVVDSMTTDISQKAVVTLGNAVVKAEVDVYIPQETAFQTRESLDVSIENYELLIDKYGNEFLRFTWTRPESIVEIDIKSRVKTNKWEKRPVGSEKFYISPTELINSDDADVISQAEDIILKKKTDFSKIAEIAKWVHLNIDYDLAYRSVNLSAMETLKNGKGVCSEFSILFQALVRAIGFETRSSLGWVISQYEEPYDFEAHSWSEVRIGDEYIPMDSTWGEGGVVDATHIKFASFPDSIYREASVKITTSRNTGKPSINLTTDVSVVNFTESYSIEVESFLLDNEIWEGSAVVRTELSAKDCILLKINSFSCGDDTGDFFDTRSERDVIYFCGEKNYFSIFDLLNPLSENTVYSCPVTIVPSLGERQTLNVKMKKNYGLGKTIDLGVSSDSVLSGEEIIIESPGNEIFTSQGDFELNKMKLKAGGEDFTVYAYSNGNLVSRDISVVNNKPFEVSLEANDTMIFGDNYTVSVGIKNLISSEQNIEIKLGNISKSVKIDSKSDSDVEIQIVADSGLIQVFADNGEFSTSSSKTINLIIIKSPADSISDFFNQFLEKIIIFIEVFL